MTAVFLVFIVLLTLALAAMVVMLKVKQINEELSIAVIFLILALISGFLLGSYLKSIRNETGI